MNRRYIHIKNGFYIDRYGQNRLEIVDSTFVLRKSPTQGPHGQWYTTVMPNSKYPFPGKGNVVIKFNSLSDVVEDCPPEQVSPTAAKAGQQTNTNNSRTPASKSAPTTSDHRQIQSVDDLKPTDSERLEKTLYAFDAVKHTTRRVAAGLYYGFLLSGPPGVGKSHTVTQELEKAHFKKMLEFSPDDPWDELDPSPQRCYWVVTGAKVTAVGLYQLLYKFRKTEQVLLFDDCDESLKDSRFLGLLLAALDTQAQGKRRVVQWPTAHVPERCPPAFDYQGSAIFISNDDLEETAANKRIKYSRRLAAVLSRCEHIDLELFDDRSLHTYVQHVATSSSLLKRADLDLNDDERKEVIEFFQKHEGEFKRGADLRVLLKLARYYRDHRDERMLKHWKKYAEFMLLRR